MNLINPFLPFRVTDTWREGHRAVDYATPEGTPFVAPGDGVYDRLPSELRKDIPGQAGHYGDLRLDDGRRIRFCHLDRHIAADGARVVGGVTVLGETGTTGTSTGPHMHTTGFNANGTRWNWTLEAARPASGGSTPFPNGDDELDDRERMMLEKLFQELLPGEAGVKTQGAVHKILTDTLTSARGAHGEAKAAHEAIDAHVAEWVQGLAGVRNAGRLYSLLARAATNGGTVDAGALASAIAPLLTAQVGALSDADVKRVAKAVNDEAAKRWAA